MFHSYVKKNIQNANHELKRILMNKPNEHAHIIYWKKMTGLFLF